jgi:hypothetical protein
VLIPKMIIFLYHVRIFHKMELNFMLNNVYMFISITYLYIYKVLNLFCWIHKITANLYVMLLTLLCTRVPVVAFPFSFKTSFGTFSVVRRL